MLKKLFSLNSFLLLSCIFCYSKEIFLFDEELIIVSCLFIVFTILFNLLSKSSAVFFKERLEKLSNLYIDKFTIELDNAILYEKRVQKVRLSKLQFGFFYIRLRANFLYFVSYNFYFSFIFFKLLVNEFLYLFFLREKIFLKKIDINNNNYIFDKFLDNRFCISINSLKEYFFFSSHNFYNSKNWINYWFSKRKNIFKNSFIFKNSDIFLGRVDNKINLKNMSVVEFKNCLYKRFLFLKKNNPAKLNLSFFYFFNFEIKNIFLFQKRKKMNFSSFEIFMGEKLTYIEGLLNFYKILNNKK